MMQPAPGAVKMSWSRRLFNRFFVSNNFFKSIEPMLFFAFIYGFTPFRVVDGSNGSKTVRTSYYSNVSWVVFLITCGISYTYTIINDESIIGYFLRNEISHFGNKLHEFGCMTGTAMCYISAVVHKKKLLRAFFLMPKIDRRFEGIDQQYNYTYSLRYVLCILCGLISMDTIIVATCYWSLTKMDVHPSPFLWYNSIGEVFGVSFSISLFCLLTRCIHRRCRLLNKVLKNLAQQGEVKTIATSSKVRSLQCLDSFSMYTIVTKNPSDIIQESMEIHHLICEAASTANKYFTYQLLTIISIAFLIIVFDAYYVLETLLGKSKRETKFKTVEFVTFFSCQMILYLFAIVSIVEGSNRAIKKSEKTGSIVHSLLNKTKNPEVKEKLQQFSLQLMHMKINFTAAGLFNIDRTLYFTISGALTTYLIILLQFTSNPPSAINNFSNMSMNDSGVGH